MGWIWSLQSPLDKMKTRTHLFSISKRLLFWVDKNGSLFAYLSKVLQDHQLRLVVYPHLRRVSKTWQTVLGNGDFWTINRILRSPPSAVKLSCFFCLSHSTKMPGKKIRRFIQSRFRGSGLQRLVVGTTTPNLKMDTQNGWGTPFPNNYAGKGVKCHRFSNAFLESVHHKLPREVQVYSKLPA